MSPNRLLRQFEKALLLWKFKLLDCFDEHYYSAQAETLNDFSWAAVTTEAAKYTWKD